jgi:hypothetical protein
MKPKSLKMILLSITMLFVLVSARAQEGTIMNRLDSIQASLMRDSLNVSDSTIIAFLNTKNNFTSSAKAIRSNQSLTPAQQVAQVQQLRMQTNNSLRSLLGNELYERFIQMIGRRTRPGP